MVARLLCLPVNDPIKSQYAILSHVWGAEEVTFQDLQDPLKRKDMKGWSKVVGACKLARSEDWEYIWIDTCCIDKSSSSELSEAINSMYRYYSKAEIWYAYLTNPVNLNFHMCKWFTRGWQELIALKTEEGWNEGEHVLSPEHLSSSSIAARISWAAGRETTRIEDRSYSLMGILGVYMPPI
ncbi:heterokaryon incompatibility protein-domain-containing protein [Rhodocollybia butyracea]|uniref:Heterokaryon incompatibility protein-domain-containing protein n=1 Tax=Rhodocollybia butyracea TaxID=206335 RepID=A0A9P5QAR8_9AGAR|nr:heterokaryon incompatibility protein-domain-containing protein [Rhodocollybia butyracea]